MNLLIKIIYDAATTYNNCCMHESDQQIYLPHQTKLRYIQGRTIRYIIACFKSFTKRVCSEGARVESGLITYPDLLFQCNSRGFLNKIILLLLHALFSLSCSVHIRG